MPAKILHLITSLERGGAQSMLVKLVQRMDPAAFAPVVVSLIPGGGYAEELQRLGIPVHMLGMTRGRPSWAALSRLRRILREEHPDLVQSWLYHADMLALIADGFGRRRPLLWNLRCTDMDAESSLQLRIVRRLLALGSGRPVAVLVNSEAGRRYHTALGYHPRRWELVPNGFDTALFRPDVARRAAWRRRLGLAADQPLIGMVARVAPMKGYEVFLAATETVAASRPDVVFLALGAGTAALQVPAALRGRFHALGEQGAVHEILPALDLAVLSSLFGEGFPNVLGEAMACGVPCVASAVGDAAAIIGETGLTVPPGEPAALARAILDLLAQPQQDRLRLAEMARRRVAEHYSLDAVTALYRKIYESVLSWPLSAP